MAVWTNLRRQEFPGLDPLTQPDPEKQNLLTSLYDKQKKKDFSWISVVSLFNWESTEVQGELISIFLLTLWGFVFFFETLVFLLFFLSFFLL